MSQPYAYINDPLQTFSELKQRLGLSPSSAIKFDQLNNHIRNTMVLPGQLIIVPDTTSLACTVEEGWLMQSARDVKQAMIANQLGGDGFVLKNYDFLQSLLGYSALGVGASTAAWSKHLAEIEKTLKEVERLHARYLRGGATESRNRFIAERTILFRKLDGQLDGMARYGAGMKNSGSIKKMLNISTRRYRQSGEIKQYAQRMAKVANAARLLKKGTYVGWFLDSTSTALEIQEVCNAGRETECTEAQFVEAGKLGAGILGSHFGGTVGAVMATAACAVALGLTTGPGALACAVIGGAGGGFAGGMLGQAGGEHAGRFLYRQAAQ